MADPVDPLDDLELDDDLDDEADDNGTGRRNSPVRPGPHDRAIADELRQLLERERYSYRSFADAVTPADPDEIWSKSRIQRLVNATRRFSLTELADMLATLGEPRERFLTKVGYISLGDDLPSVVARDVWLNPGERQAILAIVADAYRRAGITN